MPFTFKWIQKKINDYVQKLNIKGKKYRSIRKDIQNITKFLFFKLPITRIIVLKNYFHKNKIIICVRPLFGKQNLIVEKYKALDGVNCISFKKLPKNINVYMYFKNVKED